MPELADLIKTPDFLSFKDWEPQNDAGDPLKNRKSYAEYVRGEYLNAGSYNKVIEKEIQIATRDRAAEAGLINPESQEDVDKLFTSDEPDLDTKLTTIRSTLDSDSPEWRAANRYMTFKSMYPDIESLAPELAQSYEQYKQEAEQAAATGFDTAKRIKVRSGELPLAKVINEDGEEEIIGGAMMDAMKIPEAIRASKSGGISFSDALRVQSLASTPVGYKVPIYKAARYNEAAGMLSELAKNDEKTAKVIDDFSTSLSRADEDNREVFEAQKPDIAAVRRKLNQSLTAGHTFTDDEIDNAVTQLAYFQANDQSKFKLYDDPKEIGRNIRNVGYGLPIVHPAVLVSKSRFEQAMAAHTEFSDEQREALTAQREVAAANSFDSYNKTLTQSTVSSDWLNALQIGRSNGQKDADTLEQFVSNPDNFNELSSRLGGIKESVLDGFGELVAAVPTLMGADWARDYMVGNIKERQNRRETARLFGKEYGMGQDLGELIAPMLIDMAATTLLAVGSAPVGGAAGLGYAAAKSGARITAKGLVKGLASGAFRQLPTETLEEAGQRLVTTGLVRESVGAVGTKGAMAAIEGYSGRLAKTIGTGSAMAIPAYNRSAGATYANVYSQLESNKNLTPEERHDRALGAGLTAGAVTAALTAGFGAFGRGGLEDALLKGATRSELKSVMARIADVSDIDDEVFNKVIAKEVSSILKNYGSTLAKDSAKGFVDEGMEEGLDEFINGFITDAATEKNTPFLERLEQAGRAAILGGAMGAGVPAIRAAAAPMFQQSARDRQLAIEIDFAKKVSTSLAESGSPLTAETVYGILSAPRRTRARAAEAVLQGSRPAAPPTAIFSTPAGPPPPAAPAGPTPAGPTPAAPTEVTPAEVTPVGSKATRDIAKVEQLTPDEFEASFRAEAPKRAEGQTPEQIRRLQAGLISNAIKFSQGGFKFPQPFNAAAAESLGVVIPEGYLLEGELYVYRPDKAAPVEVEGEAQYVAPTDLDVMDELLKTDITSAGELIDSTFGDKIVPTSYDPETQLITYVDEDGNEAETSLQSLDLTGNQEAIAKLRPKMPQTLAAVEKISAALHANTSPEVVASSIATDPDKAPEVGMDIDPIPNPVAKKNRKLAPKKDKSPVVEQLELKEQAAKKKATAPEGELNLQLSTPDKPPVKVPRARRSVKQQSKSSLAEQLGLDILEEDVIEQSNHGGSVPDEEVVADAVVESTTTSIPIPVAEAVQAVVVGKKPKAVRVKKPKAPAVVAETPLTFDEETFLDDEFTGQEISTLQRLIGYGFPVRLETKALFGYPKRAQYDKGYLEGKSDLISRKIAEIYKPIAIGVQKNWTAVSGTKITALNPKTNKKSRIRPKGYVNENGVGVFDNNPLTMMALMENNHPVVITEDFDINTINPAFRYSRLGTEYILTDIVKVNPESGSGFVSALMRQESTLTEEPDYDFIQKVSDFENLFDRRTAGEQMIPDPDSPSVMIKLSDVANRVTDLIRMGREPLQFQGSKERRVAGKSRAEAIAIIKNATKPTRATLTPEFQETAAIALDLAYRRAVRLYAMRLSFNKFSELKSGEAFPSLKPDKINAAISQFVDLTKPEGADQKVTIAKRLQQTYGSEIDPETNPDLVIANFIEKRILTTPEVAPTFRSVGSKVGNMYAGQQRTRNIYARRAVFQTTSPEDVTKLQADREYNASLEVSDYFIAPDADLFSPTPQFTKDFMELASSAAVDSIDADPELRTALNKLLRSTLYKDNSAFDISGLTSQDAFSQLAQWMSSGSYATNTEAIAFQRGLERGDYENGTTLRRVLKLMHLASISVTGTLDQDPDYVSELARNLTASFGRTVTDKQAREFAKSIGQASTRLFSRSYVRGEQVEYVRNLNNADAASLGLRSGDPQSVINALRIIAATDADPNKKLLARLLLENQASIKQVTFSLDEVSAPYAGQFTVMADGSLAVSLNLNGYNGRGLADALLHEYLHAFVNKVVSAPSDLQTSDQRAAIQRLNGILNLVRDAAAAKGIDSPMLTDGLASLNEFVAHFFTSTDFQNLVKTLTPPAKQRGFFARILDAMLDVFGMGKSTQSAYQQAFTDVIDLTRSAIHSSPNTSKGLINKLSVRSSMLLDRAKSVGTSFGAVTGEGTVSVGEQEAAAEAEQAAARAAEEAEAADLMAQVALDPLPFDPTTDTKASMQEAMKRSMLLIRKLVPKEIQLQWSADAPMAEVDLTTGVMSVNPQNIAALIAGKTPAQARLAIKTMIDEEMRHVASFNSLTQAEVDAIVAAKKDSDFEDIANQYYNNEANRAAALERLRSEDPNVSGVEKIRLVEERLRMLAQRVQRNTTTEEDYAFWRTNPSTLSILGRYFKNMLNSMFGKTDINNNAASFVRGKTILAMSADERIAVARIVVEMRALQVGYRLAPNSMRFDPENPSDVVGMFESQLGTSFGDVEAELTRSSFPMSALNLLHGGKMAPTKATNRVVANDLAKMANGFWGGLVTSKNVTPEQIELLTENCTQEVIAALNASGKNAADWYSTAIEVAMGVASVIHPELSNVEAARAVPAFAASEDPVQAARFAMRMALAITSQNINVEQNTRYAEEQFTLLKLNGKFDGTKSYGSKADAIKSNLNLANLLVAKQGYAKAEEFVKKEFTVKDLSVIASEIRGKKVSVTGANQDKVNGAAIFGPKIGQGFLQNLMSNFDPVTVDLWMRRTWGRWTGDVVGDGVTEDRLTNLILGAKAAKMSLPEELKKIRFVPALNSKGRPIEKDGVVKMTVHHSAVTKLETDPKFRDLCNSTATKLDAEWQRQFKLLRFPMNKKLYEDLLSGALPLNKYIASVDTLISKIDEEHKALVASKKLPPISREAWMASKTKTVNADAKKNKLTEAERNARLNELPIKFDKLAADNKLPRIPIGDWRLEKFAKAGRDIVITNEEVSAVKPSWANAASVIKSKLNPIDAPSDQDRRVITEIVNKSRLQLKALGFDTTNADIQAILWYPEKDLWALLTGKPESNLKSSYDEEFINIAIQRGLGDDALAIADSIRTDRATRDRGRDDRGPTGPVTGQAPVSVGTSFGDVSQLPSRFDADKMDFSNFLEALDMPMLEVGTYRSPKNVLDRLFKGELDPRINTLKNHRDFFKTAAMSLVQNYKAKLDGIIKKDFGSLENAPLDDIAAAIGSTRGTILDEDVVNQIEDTYQAALETISIDDTLTAKEKTAARKVALDTKMQAVEAERVAQGDAIRVARDAALESLAKQSPELARHIVQLRTLTDEVSKRVSSLYGFKPELEATFDSQLGIYLTRSYKMFHEVGFADIVRSDPSYEPQRQAAMDFFADQFVKNEVERRVKAGERRVKAGKLTADELEADARAAALIELGTKASNGRTISENALEEFIAQYEKSGTYGVAGGATMSESFRVLQKNIKQKKDVPAPLRAILGEYGPESGTDNLLRSFVTVASMAANQSFLQNVKSIGVDGGWLMTRAQLDANQVADYETYKNYAPLRTAKVTTAYDPLGDLFGPPELIDGLNKVFSAEAQRQNMDTAQDWVANTTKTFAKLTGAAMAAKTLGSLGFYVRNFVSNVAFFGPSQGFYSLNKMTASAGSEIRATFTDPNQIEAYRTELISLGVIGNEVKASIMADLLRGTSTIQSAESQLDKLIEIGNAGTKPLAWITEKAQRLSSAIDASYKIAYFENELRVLESARAEGGGKFATMTDYELKREAARKVLMTAQSASQAPPLVKEITKSGFGLLLAPFIRFKAEVPRIFLNTYKLSFEEMRSGNSVIARRGAKRFSGMTFVIGTASVIAPAIIRWMQGIGDEEDEALRASLPSYLRNHTFFYRRDDNGQLQSWDFTFLNPFSLIGDPAMRSLELIFRGEPAKAAAKFVETAFFDQYLDDQIFSSAIQSLRDNRDPATEKPIYEPKIDSTGAIIFKSMSHVFIQAYRPSVMTRAIKAYQAVGADYTDFDYSPMGILLQEVYPVKRHKIELDKQLRRYLSESRDVYNRINERKNVLFSQKPVDEETIRELLKSEVEDKAALNEDIYRKLRGYEGLGLKPQDSYSIMTSKNMGYGKDRSRLLFNKLMDRPVLTPDFQDRLRNPENEQGLLRLQIAEDELKKYSRYLLLEP